MNQNTSSAARVRTHLSAFAAAVLLVCASSLSASLFAADPPPAPVEPPKNTVRPEIATPLRAAQALLKEKKFAEALVEIDKTDAIPMQTPYEVYLIQHLRGVSAANSGKNELAAKSLEAVLATGQAPEADIVHIHEALAQIYSKAKDYRQGQVHADGTEVRADQGLQKAARRKLGELVEIHGPSCDVEGKECEQQGY